MRSRLLDQYMDPLLRGDRAACRELIHSQMGPRMNGQKMFENVLWPAMERVERLYRRDEINIATEHMATRINRTLADQLQTALKCEPSKDKRIVIMCADGEPEELGAQMCADLFEANGWSTFFVGCGVPNDEVLSLTGQLRPDVLMIYGTKPHGVPNIRVLIDQIREVGATPTMNIMLSGGIYNRAEGLWNELNADLFAQTAQEALKVANDAEPRTPEVRTPGGTKKRRRRRRSPLLAAAGEA
jgi:methanogenic corrinoid protein MtbC1